MFDIDSDILTELTDEINLADAFISRFNASINFNKLNGLTAKAQNSGLSLSRNVYEELEARFDFEFLVINNKTMFD